jgi:hypothetical protein
MKIEIEKPDGKHADPQLTSKVESTSQS